MTERSVRITGLMLSVGYAALIGWLYLRQPQTFAEVTGGISASVGLYRVDQAAFADAVRFFHNDQFAEARMAFERADPAQRDAVTQFYIAYSYYRQGWGRLYHDDELYARGLQAVDRALALAPTGRLIVDDERLGMHSGEELKTELESGLRRELGDFNPAKMFRPRR